MSSICLKAMSRISMIDPNQVIRDSLSHLRAEVPQEIKEELEAQRKIRNKDKDKDNKEDKKINKDKNSSNK